MPGIHKWWKGRSYENSWLEVTRREDIGVNLKAPQFDEHGTEFWSYALIKEIRSGDTVYHYDGKARAIIARSLAYGAVWEDEIVWAARGLSARSANISPHPRPGWYLGLERFDRLAAAIKLDEIRARSDAIVPLVTSLTIEVGKPLYFPFELGKRRAIRPMQGYLFKLPSDFLALFEIKAPTPAMTVRSLSLETFGDTYRLADQLAAVAERDPFSVDPALVERGIRGHAITQNLAADYLRGRGIERSPGPNEPNFDIAWSVGKALFVAEVKSLTVENEEKQLRLGLGQVLRYAHLLGSGMFSPVLIVERQPSDFSWKLLCQQLGVILAWPDVFPETLGRHTPGAEPAVKGAVV